MPRSTARPDAPDPKLIALAMRLQDARNFVEIGLAVCASRASFGLAYCELSLLAADGRAAITVEQDGADRAELATLVFPIFALAQLIGVFRCGLGANHDWTALHTVTLHVSVRLAQLGISQPATRADLEELTRRQLDVAALTVRGYTNVEIADLLDVSVNTVKKHLGCVFERLQVTNRTELAGRFLGVHPDGLPDGATRIGDCTVTKALGRRG